MIMKEVIVDLNGAVPSNIGFVTVLCSEATKYVSDILINTISENKVSQSIDLKSVLGAVSLNYCTKEIKLTISGIDEEVAAKNLEATLEHLVEMYK